MSTSPCCGCIELGTGVIIIGILESIGSAISTISQVSLLAGLAMGTEASVMYVELLGPMVTKSTAQGALIFLFLLAAYGVIVGIVLILAGVQKNPSLCTTGMILLIISTVISVIFYIFLIVGSPIFILPVFITIAIRAYVLWVVCAFKAELDSGGGVLDNVVYQRSNQNFNNETNFNYGQSQTPGNYSGYSVQNQAYSEQNQAYSVTYSSGYSSHSQDYPPPPYHSGNLTQNQGYPAIAPIFPL